MAKEFKLPNLGENISSGEIVKILVSAGDKIQRKQTVLEIETDKAVIEVPSSVSGVVDQIYVKEGETAEVGQLLLTLSGTAQPEEAKAQDPAGPDKDGVSPLAEKTEVLAEPEPEPQPAAQVLEEPVKERVLEVVPPPSRPASDREEPRSPLPASPSVRRFAREIGVDLQAVQGSGPKGRIAIQDVKNHAREARRGTAHPPMRGSGGQTQGEWGFLEKVPFGGVRRATARHISESWRQIPHVTNFDQSDITELEVRRRSYGKRLQDSGAKLTITAIVLKVLASALRLFPKFNATIDVDEEMIVYKRYCNIGVAVDTDRGLLVPVIRDVDQKSIAELAVEVQSIAQKARDRKIRPEDLQGGTFTLTNLGGLGTTQFTPIINIPEVAILGVSRALTQPVRREDSWEPRLILPLSVSYDHRLIDGADAARFLRWVAQALEDPFLILYEG